MRAALGALAASALSRCHSTSSSHSLLSMTDTMIDTMIDAMIDTWAPSGPVFYGVPPRECRKQKEH
jgi:hypothetical protein